MHEDADHVILKRPEFWHCPTPSHEECRIVKIPKGLSDYIGMACMVLNRRICKPLQGLVAAEVCMRYQGAKTGAFL